jgi:hypothetical protein
MTRKYKQRNGGGRSLVAQRKDFFIIIIEKGEKYVRI